MKTKLLIIALFAMFSVPVVAQTNVTTNAVVSLPPAFEQVANLIGPQFKSYLTNIVVWIGSISLIVAPFGKRLGNWLRDRLNLIAEGKAVGTDVWLRKLFDNPFYKFISTGLRFVSIDLPTTSELDRALLLQAEAVAAAKPKTP